jgi:hypothetical protein
MWHEECTEKDIDTGNIKSDNGVSTVRWNNDNNIDYKKWRW